MIIHLHPSTFCAEDSVRARLEILERGLRRTSNGEIKLGDYGRWLETAAIPVPSRQTLRQDMERYARYCDDLIYGEQHKKTLVMDVHARRDAIRYFLGEPWLASPLHPRLSSAVCRSLLLAMHLREEVEFSYAALPQPGLAPTFKLHRGVPLRTLPGSDSGYMAIWLEYGAVIHINLARVQGSVAFTDCDIGHYQPLPVDPSVVLNVNCADLEAAARGADQFGGAVRNGLELRFTLPESLALMTADLLESWWRRTSGSPRQAERLLDLPGGQQVRLSIQQEEDS
ncbi:MAG TPA: hypothetical protein PLW86_17945 [Rhodocyclaceae bacterium]|nr:hypothetical protein [Rhodocyclaceae bacterium]